MPQLARPRQDGVLEVGRGRGRDRRIDPAGALVDLLEDRDAQAVGPQLAVEDVDLDLEALVGRLEGVYQSVMITPPKGSAETSGMKERVSSEARHSRR